MDSEKPLGLSLNPWSIFPKDIGNIIPGQERAYTPLQNHLHTILREPFKELIANDIVYEKYFDKFEYLLSLNYADLENKKSNRNDFRFPYGRFGWKAHDDGMEILNKISIDIFQNDFDSLKKHGFFDGSLSRFEKLHNGLAAWVKNLNIF